jgi:RDD family
MAKGKHRKRREAPQKPDTETEVEVGGDEPASPYAETADAPSENGSGATPRRRGLFAGPRRPGPWPLGPEWVPAPDGRRAAAIGIDAVALGALLFLALSALIGGLDLGGGAAAISVAVAVFVTVLAYTVGPVVRIGQTFGQRMTRIAVVEEATGTRPGLRTATTRYVIPAVLTTLLLQNGGLLAVILGLSYLMDPDRKGLVDKLAKTRVVARPAGAPEEGR